MTDPEKRSAFDFYVGRGFSVMLVLLLGVLAISFAESTQIGQIPLGRSVLSLALIAGVYASEVNRRMLWTAVGIALLIPVWQWLATSAESEWLREAHNAPEVALIGYTLYVMSAHVFRTERVTADKIYGAICLYLLLVAFWAILYEALSHFSEDAFAFARDVGGSRAERGSELFYYSWVTLTTTGYGDITPVHPAARLLAALQSIAGQFYLAIVVARLVALYITQRIAGGQGSSA